MIGKCYVIIFFVLFACFSVQAEIKGRDLVLGDHFISKILSGEKEKIEYVVDTWIALLLEAEEAKNLYPSNLRTERDFRQFFQLLETADKEKNSLDLIKISDAYLSSAETTYRYILRNNLFAQESNSSFLYNFNVFLEYLLEGQQIDTMMKEWYISLVFLSLAGFSSPHGKFRYISSIEKIQFLYDFFHKFFDEFKPIFHNANASRYRLFRSYSGPTVIMTQHFKNIIEFQENIYRIDDFYSEVILPSFMGLSWVKYDVKNYSNHPEVLFKYGRILHRAYGKKDKGLFYISLSAEQNYLPAVKYLGGYYLHEQGFLLNEGEQLMMKFLQESKNFKEKVKIMRELFFVNIMRGNGTFDSFQRGTSSLKKSCRAIFRSDQAVHFK